MDNNDNNNNDCEDMWSLNLWLDKKRKRNKKRVFWATMVFCVFFAFPIASFFISVACDESWIFVMKAPYEFYKENAFEGSWIKWIPIAYFAFSIFTSRYASLFYYGTEKQKREQRKIQPIYATLTILGVLAFFVEFTPTFGYILVFILLAVIFRR